LGYSQPSHFSREFKRFHGMSPTSMRERDAAAQMSLIDTECRSGIRVKHSISFRAGVWCQDTGTGRWPKG
jgi:AraC-like DNA-binding protein